MIELLRLIGEHASAFSLIGVILVCMSLIFLWHFDKKTRFDLRDLLIDGKTKELSIYKTGQFVALIVSTWIILHETNAGKLSEWLFGFYMITWSGTNLARKYLERKEDKKAE
jgi:hypothetical protein